MTVTNDALLKLAQAAIEHARSAGLRIVTAESCTGGLIAGMLTSVGGSSDVVEGGFVTYSNALKQSVLGVSQKTLREKGAVSEDAAIEMAFGARGVAPNASLALATTGIAGPGGGTKEKPVGTVCFAVDASTLPPRQLTFHFAGDREAVRLAAVKTALYMIIETCQNLKKGGDA